MLLLAPGAAQPPAPKALRVLELLADRVAALGVSGEDLALAPEQLGELGVSWSLI